MLRLSHQYLNISSEPGTLYSESSEGRVQTSADQIIALYERHALEYVADRAGSRCSESVWLDQFIVLLPAGGTVLDIGCGAGDPMARYLVDRNFEIDGVDSSPTLVQHCKRSLPSCRWHVADMRALKLGRTFDGILAWDSFFHLSHDDQRRMFPISREHAKPHTALMFTSGASFGEAIGSYRGEALYHASLSADEYWMLLQENGFRVIAHVVEDPRCGGHTVWLAQQA
jgi:2-polyprenyl-3-methyl-5-hydroxy-6-metoxy-1,4-benzoquinol methylase